MNPVNTLFPLALLGLLGSFSGAAAIEKPADADNFYKSEKVDVRLVSFENQYKMKVVGNLCVPKENIAGEKYPAIIVGHPMGAVKEQSANLYATK
ncbi:MAG: alpha/beta hydrolase, partial [Planctomycetia bacterium]|nr:alpha/beta hydrolase [Planctomycetia bacterium]